MEVSAFYHVSLTQRSGKSIPSLTSRILWQMWLWHELGRQRRVLALGLEVGGGGLGLLYWLIDGLNSELGIGEGS